MLALLNYYNENNIHNKTGLRFIDFVELYKRGQWDEKVREVMK